MATLYVKHSPPQEDPSPAHGESASPLTLSTSGPPSLHSDPALLCSSALF